MSAADAIATTLLPGWRTGIAYYRISDDPEHDELGVKRQQRNVRAKAEREQIHLVAEYFDDDRSAFSRRRRPGYEQTLEHAKTVDVVMSWHPDRMTRGDLVEIERLIVALGGDEGTPIVTCETGDYDVSTPHGRMIARITGSIARYESEHKSRRITEKMKELADAGRSGGGRRPFGYQAGGKLINKREAELVREAVRRILAGDSTRAIAADFNRRGILTSVGNPWHPGPLKQMLSSSRIAGMRTYKGRVVAKAEWPAIISEDQHRRILATLEARTPIGRRGRTPWLLTGLLRCGRCGASLIGNVNSNASSTPGQRRYQCRKGPGHKGCGGLGIKAEPLEELLGDLASERLANTAARRAAITDDSDDAAELAELNRIAADRIAVADAGATLSLASRLEEYAALDRRQRDAESRLAGKVRASAPLDFVAAAGFAGRRWKDLELDEKRIRLNALINTVTVAPAAKRGSTRFEAERVTEPGQIDWKI